MKPVPVKPLQSSVVTLQRRRRPARVVCLQVTPAGDSAKCSQSHERESQLRAPVAPAAPAPSPASAPATAPVTAPVSPVPVSHKPRKCSTLATSCSNSLPATPTRPLPLRTSVSAINAPAALRTNLQPVPTHLLNVLLALDLNRAGDAPPTAAAAPHQSSSSGSSSYAHQMAEPSNETGPFFDVISSTIADSYGCTLTSP